MKTNHVNRTKKGAKPNSRRRGVALITVLTIMSLATILIMTFFSLAQNELNASSSYSEGLQAQQVAEQAVNMLIRQIRKATSNAGLEEQGDMLAWASQPGAIRTWRMTGEFYRGYKLYSDDEMVVDDVKGEQGLVDDDYADFANWDQKTWSFVDLNEPVIRGDRVYYPIVDPIARDEPEWPGPLGGDTAGIEGFDWHVDEISQGPMKAVVEQRQREVLPMPARWIYQLKDGTLGFVDDAKTFKPLQESGQLPRKENPIVARFAFWADDETCKLNPNVHAGGASWATPMAGGDIDRNLGRFQPAQHEWQRYPGHAATTHLAPVIAPGITDITYQRDNMELIFGLVPRVVGGGSLSGTTKVNMRDPRQQNGLIADKDRLYPSLDEFIMRPDRDPNRFPKAGTRGGRSQDTKYMQEQIERMKFFLTVVSRAPEVTVFNTPRVSIWPTRYNGDSGFIQSEGIKRKGHHTPFDELIRFCAEVGQKEKSSIPGVPMAGTPSDVNESRPGFTHQYHFQRANADSATYDYYKIPRNQELLAYLERLTRTPIPGVGGGTSGSAGGSPKSFADKYPAAERLQLLTEIFDYIRSTNLHDDTVYQSDWKEAFQAENVVNHLTYTNGRRIDRNSRLLHKGHGQVTPIRIDYQGSTNPRPVSVNFDSGSNSNFQTKGMGRFYSLLEMGVQIICCADGGDGTGGGPATHINPGTTEYRVGWTENPNADNDWSNFPPMHAQFDPGNEGTWPNWLKDFKMDPLFPIAVDPTRWNWQLAWLDDSYESAMPGSKFDRGALTKTDDTRLKAGEKLVQAALLFQMFTPSLGWVPINPDMEIDIQIEGMTFDDGKVEFGWGEDGRGVDLKQDLDPGYPGEGAWASSRISRTGENRGWTGGDRTYGGVKPATYFMRAGSRNLNTDSLNAQEGRTAPIDRFFPQDPDYRHYHYITKPWKITSNSVTMSPGEVTMMIYSAGEAQGTARDIITEQTAAQAPPQLVQELHIPFETEVGADAISVPAPFLSQGRNAHINEFGGLSHHKLRPGAFWSLSYDGINPHRTPLSQYDADGRGRGRLGRAWGLGDFLRAGDVLQSVGVRHGDARLVAARALVRAEDNLFKKHHNWGKGRMAHNFASTPGNRASGSSGDKAYNLVPDVQYHGARRPYAMQLDDADAAQRYGDFDNGMGNSIDGPYINKPDEGNTHSLFNRSDRSAQGIGMWDLRRDYGDFPYFVRDYLHEAGTPAYFSPNRIISSPGMFGSLPVGTMMPWNDTSDGDRQIGQPWRTLLFRPNVSGIQSSGLYDPHPGGVYAGKHPANDGEGPPDHYFLDLFWMPVVEPYAISEPLSTAGKVNLNYQILPYTNIDRSTALRGVFKSEYMLCIPNQWARDYKIGVGRGRGYHWRDNPYGGTLQAKSLRTIILEDKTLEQFEERFQAHEIFKTASEICEIHLVPEELIKRMNFGGARGSIQTYTPSVEDMENGKYWSDHAVVGDNGRERPYSNIYTRLTTKSNTYKVHYRAQVVKQASPPGRDFTKWDETYDTMVAEYRGSSIVERYVEPNDPDIPDYATEVAGSPLAGNQGFEIPGIDEYYKFRVVNPTRFAP